LLNSQYSCNGNKAICTNSTFRASNCYGGTLSISGNGLVNFYVIA
jgi:hypothetical protein